MDRGEGSFELIIAGRPNSGKSTLFNQLAPVRQKVGNYSGCTVEKKTSEIELDGRKISITDLPGLYSIKPNSLDEKVAIQHLESCEPGAYVLVVLDGNNLKIELPLPLALKENGYNVIVAVNMLDEVEANQRILDLKGMSELAGIPFFGISAKKGTGIAALKKFLACLNDPSDLNKTNSLSTLSDKNVFELFLKTQEQASALDRLNRNPSENAKSKLALRNEKLDWILIHPVLGPSIFIVVMLALFEAVFTWSGPFVDGIDEGFTWLADVLRDSIENPLIGSLIADGLIAGVGSVLVFVPQIAILFFLLALLELTGYLPRISYMLDRLFKPFGLDGKVFIPLLSSMACAVPGIMATRTIENPKIRYIAMMIAPLMTCAARLPVYTLLIAAFIPNITVFGFFGLPAIVMAGLYLLGIVTALLVSLIFRISIRSSANGRLDFIHLPNYRVPSAKDVMRYVWTRVVLFVRKAGTIIASMTIALWFLLSFPGNPTAEKQFERDKALLTKQMERYSDQDKEQKFRQNLAELENRLAQQQLEASYGGRIGKFLEPVFAPIGYDWKITIGVFASLAAREVFVATLGTILALGETDEESVTLIQTLRNEKKADGTAKYTLATCLSLLVFFAFALQCVSTLGILKRETDSWSAPLVAFSYMALIGYLGAFCAYQVGLWLV